MQLVIVLLLLFAGIQFFRLCARLPPAAIRRYTRSLGAWVALAGAAFLFLRGKPEFGAVLGLFGLSMLGFIHSPPKELMRNVADRFSGFLPPWLRLVAHASNIFGQADQSQPDIARWRTAMIEIELNKKTGVLTSMVLCGPEEGRSLDALTQSECDQLYRQCQAQDSEGARLLEAYMQRRFAGWRQAGERDRNPGSRARNDRGGNAAMSEDEAYKVLGLGSSATVDEIGRAHRALMKKLHPDHGGSTDLAARVNEARDVLMRRHH